DLQQPQGWAPSSPRSYRKGTRCGPSRPARAEHGPTVSCCRLATRRIQRYLPEFGFRPRIGLTCREHTAFPRRSWYIHGIAHTMRGTQAPDLTVQDGFDPEPWPPDSHSFARA